MLGLANQFCITMIQIQKKQESVIPMEVQIQKTIIANYEMESGELMLEGEVVS